jgi:Leucine-rich repeat (LRR) protein
MKNTKSLLIILALLTCSNQALHGMKKPLTLPGNFAQLPREIQQEITSKLSDSNLAMLAQTSKQASQVLEDKLARRHLQAATELSLWESRIPISFSCEVTNYPSFNEFKQAVLNRLDETAKQKPDQWISLYLSTNNLGLLEDLNAFIQSIAKYNIVELDFSENQLTSLPENIFKNLPKLQRLSLDNNQLTSLPENIFNNLHNLEYLHLEFNKLTSLPKSIYRLHNLRELYLSDQLKETQKIRKALPKMIIHFLRRI